MSSDDSKINVGAFLVREMRLFVTRYFMAMNHDKQSNTQYP